ncbi:hypothetical protein C266_11305 [Pandoraea sp. SD6-2]|nr:hypothetical protein C266_11305 [Pandoraea sp. SD6-2]
MPDNKTVTFDACREAVGRITELQRRSGGPAWMEAKGLLANDLTFIAQGLIDALAAPTPAAQSADHFRQPADMVDHVADVRNMVAAQSAGQEPVACPKCGCEDGVAYAPYWNHKGDWTAEAIWVCDKCDGERIINLDAAPVNASEPVGSVKVIESGPAREVGEPILTLSKAFEDMLDHNPGKSFDLYAAPVNGGERAKPAPLYLTGWQLLEALDLIAPDRNTDKDQLDGEAALQYGDETCHSGAGVYCWLAEEPSEGSTILLGEPVEHTQQPAQMPQPVPANAVWTRHGSGDCEWWDYGSWKAHKRGGMWVLTAYGKEISRAVDLQRVMAFASQPTSTALTSPAKVGGDQRERFVHWFTRGTGRPISANDRDAETAWDAWRAALTSPAQVGGDEREAFFAHAKAEDLDISLHADGTCRDGQTGIARIAWLAALEYASAALSADGGEAAKHIAFLTSETDRLREALAHWQNRASELADGGEESVRLDFLIKKQAWVQWEGRDGSIYQCQVWTQDHDENYHILSGDSRYFNTPREAIDAAIAANQARKGE